MILPPPLDSHLMEVESSTVKRNPKPKLTTFKSPEAQIMGTSSPPSPSVSSPQMSPVNNSAGILVNAESAHLQLHVHGQKIG
jgi:hypothetical protein